MRTRILFLAVLFSLTSCQTSPTGRKQLALVPDSQMAQMGEQAFAELKAKQPIDNDSAINNYVKCVAGAITAVLPEKQTWEVVVFRDESPNAFALPGGKIGVQSGILKVAKTPAQLGTVLGHEVGHVLAGHSKERVSEEMVTQGGISLLGGILASKENPKRNIIMGALGLGAQFGVTLPHSRTQESEADLIGLDLMAQAGFDPRESLVLWKNMEEMGGSQPPVFLSDHPSHGSRIDNLQSHMEKALVTFQKAGSHPNCHQ